MVQSYAYDALNRLKTVAEASTGWSQDSSYASGNRSIIPTPNIPNLWPPGFNVSPFAPTTNNSAGYNAANQLMLAAGTHYDAAGNQDALGGFGSTFDAEGRLTSSTVNGTTVSYVYDGEGQRVAKIMCPTASPCDVTTAGATVLTIYVYDASGQLAAEYSPSVSPTSPPCATCYVTVDHLGSTRLVTDEAGNAVRRYDYLPFGEEISADGTARTVAKATNSWLTE